ncbi:hypothetical protein [Brevinema andersonii]|nr:hypothetical protein [Brevinema andersonii]
MSNRENIWPKEVMDAKASGYRVVKIANDAGQEFYFRKPNKAELLLFQDQALKGKGTASGRVEKLLSQLLVYPIDNTLMGYIEEKPLAVGDIFAELIKDMGAEENFTALEI